MSTSVDFNIFSEISGFSTYCGFDYFPVAIVDVLPLRDYVYVVICRCLMRVENSISVGTIKKSVMKFKLILNFDCKPQMTPRQKNRSIEIFIPFIAQNLHESFHLARFCKSFRWRNFWWSFCGFEAGWSCATFHGS
jgi:hypothetical protein